MLTNRLLATAYENRRCSPRSMGGWARRTHRRWVMREVRFEIQFSTPRIHINLGPAHNTEAGNVVQQHFGPYKFIKAKRNRTKLKGVETQLLDASENPEYYRVTDNPWFLRTDKAMAAAKCSWLSLLQDTAKVTDVEVVVEETKGYLDLIPDGSRPLATADRKSFLTLMCLFGIHWENKGKDRHFAGAGEFCEVSVSSVPYYGSVFVYHDLHARQLNHSRNFTNQRFCLYSEKARLAMFHCFDLGFATFRTQNDFELVESLKNNDALSSDEDTVNRVAAFYRGANAWCPGLSESITCWADKSMPKMFDTTKNKFKSMFSAVSARSLTTGNPKFVAMLLGDGSSHPHRNGHEVQSIQTVTEWAKGYLSSFPHLKEKVCEGLHYAANWPKEYGKEYRDQNNIVDVEIRWDMSSHCLEGVRALDRELEKHFRSLPNFGEEDQRKLKSAISSQQIKHGSRLYEDATKAAKEHRNSWWMDEVDRVGAENYIDVVNHVNEDFQIIMRENPLLTQQIVVNRLMRGSLWVIHNGNAPDQVKRVSECSLSSTVLEDNPTVYIS